MTKMEQLSAVTSGSSVNLPPVLGTLGPCYNQYSLALGASSVNTIYFSSHLFINTTQEIVVSIYSSKV